MSKFIFENEEEYNLEQLKGVGAGDVINSWLDNYDDVLQFLDAGQWRIASKDHPLNKKWVYRVLKKQYTLEDALHDIDMCSNAAFLDEAILECKNIAAKLAASMEGDK